MVNDSNGSVNHGQPDMEPVSPEDSELTILLGLSRAGANRDATKDKPWTLAPSPSMTCNELARISTQIHTVTEEKNEQLD